MKKINEKGFTLIELLAIILILGILAVITTVTVKNIIDSAEKKTFINSVQGMINAGNLYYSRQDMMGKVSEDVIFTFPNNAD